MTETAIDEACIRNAFVEGDFELTARLTLQAYSREIFNFLAARMRAPSDAEEIFSMFAEDLWAGLPKFAWRCSMRTWAYTLARNAANRYATAAHRRPQHNVRLSLPGVFSQLVEQVRYSTHIYQRTDAKNRFVALREQLDADDQLLLILRVDRKLSFRDLAFTLSGDPDLDDKAVTREAARLRKSFERVKAQLKLLAQQEGLLDSHD